MFFVRILKVNDENSRIQIRFRIHNSEGWIRGYRSGSTPKCHGSATLVKSRTFYNRHDITATGLKLILPTGYLNCIKLQSKMQDITSK
jgi:hypothetical protein